VTSEAELTLAVQLEQAGIPFLREVALWEGRRFRADFVIPTSPRIVIEVEGGAWVVGRHTRGAGFEADCEKQALAVIAGHRYLRVTSAQVEDGRAFGWIRQLMGFNEAAA
jgi:very-short-patch-repair endonuclease